MNRILTLLCFIIMTWFFAPEAKAQTKVLADTSFMQDYCACNYDKIDGFFDKGKTLARSTLNRNMPVYGYPVKTTKVMDTLKPFTAIVYLKEGTDPATKIKWLKVKYEQADRIGVYREKQGYITDHFISIGSVNGDNPKENIDFVLAESPLMDADLKQPRFRLNAVHRFTGKNYKEASKVVSQDLSIGAVNNYNHFYLTGVYNSALSNMTNLLRLYWHHGESCPESDGHVFIAYSNGKMQEIIHAGSSGEAGLYEFTKVYVPLKFDKGKILLVENGDSEQMFNPLDATLRTIPYPKDCGIPIAQLVVTVEESAEGKTDAKGDFILGKDGQIAMTITDKIIRYFRWDGIKLREEKKLVIKKP